MARLIALLLIGAFSAACEAPRQPVEISFVLDYEGAEIGCDNAKSTTVLTDMRVYIHALELIDQAGQRLAVELLPDALWQNDAVALLDFEDGSASCVNGSEQTNRTIRGQYITSDSDLAGLSFRVGVPATINHHDPTIAEAPLTYTSMHWHWASGYKFLSAGVATENDAYWLHLGSSRCAGTIGNIEGCKSSNRPSVLLQNFDPERDVVSIDLGRLFAGIDLIDGVATDCSSGPIEKTCDAPFDALGIDTSDGSTARNTEVFGVARPL